MSVSHPKQQNQQPEKDANQSNRRGSFAQVGDCEGAMLRPGNVHSADRWKELLEPLDPPFMQAFPLESGEARFVCTGL